MFRTCRPALQCLLTGRPGQPSTELPCLLFDQRTVASMATTEGGSKCLDAFILALNQACDGQKMRWYVSTLELQLASLGFCGACRSAQTLEVRVDEDTPPTLWPCRTSHTTPSQRSPEVCISNRVPAVQAFGWMWKLAMDRLPQRTATELQPGPEQRRRRNDRSVPASVRSVVWPQTLKRLVFDSDMPVNTVSRPVSMQELWFRDTCNLPIHDVVWPTSLLQLSFGRRFNQQITDVVWPASLQQLSFGYDFNQPIVGVTWPASVKQLSFNFSFNQPIVRILWPASLKQLSFGFLFNQAIVGATWPVSLLQLSFGDSLDRKSVV
ncbi:unnamed protein product [Ectocarpus fasciculatus]